MPILKDDAGVLGAVTVCCTGTPGNVVTATVYDNTQASGTVLAKVIAGADTKSAKFEPCVGILFRAGLFCDVSGTDGEAVVSFI